MNEDTFDDGYESWGMSELIERIHDLEKRVEGDTGDAQHPFRQSAIHIIEEIIEPLVRPLEGEEYYRIEDAIVGVINRSVNK